MLTKTKLDTLPKEVKQPGFFKRNWLSIFLFLLSCVLAYVLYLKSIREREPKFWADDYRTEIINKNNILDAPIKVIKKNGEEIKSNLNSVRVYFWNEGKEPIKKENTLNDLKIILDDNNAEIISYKILKISRNVTEIKLLPDSGNIKRSLKIDYKILEMYDGFSAQILYQGKNDAKIKITGNIEGVRDINQGNYNTNNYSYIFVKRWGINVIRYLIIIMLTFATMEVISILKAKKKIYFKKLIRDTFQGTVLIGLIIVIIISFFATKFELDYGKNLSVNVPEEIIK